MPFQRNVESSGLWIDRFITGLVTERSPLYTPISAMGLQFVSRLDALIDGLNMEISPTMTMVRRPSYQRFCSVAFGANDYPLNYFSFENSSGIIRTLADTPGKVYQFTATTNASVLNKSTSGRGDFYGIGNYLYYCNGVDRLFWDGTTWNNWGIVAPASAPTLTFGAGTLSPTSGYKYVVCYVNTITGHVSAASPVSASTGPLTSQEIMVTYSASSDPQVNAIWIFRTADGGGIYYFLASVANTNATYNDLIPDTQLNTFITAPLAPGNAPCPAGASLVEFWDGRLWVASGSTVYWAMGASTITGLGTQAFDLTNNQFGIPLVIRGMAATSQGLIIFTSDTAWIITGTGGAYFINPWQNNFGIKNADAVTQDGDLVFVFTSRGQVFEIGSGLTEIGHAIRGKLSAMNPNSVSIAIHRSGLDEGLFVSDGSANVYRYSMTFGAWSPVAQPTQGAGIIKSIETSDAVWTLLLGSHTGGGYIAGRNLTSWTDDGGTYTCYSTIGSLIIGPPGSKNAIENVFINASTVGSYPTVSILTNEIRGTFALLPDPVSEPPALPSSLTISTKRHYLKSGFYPGPRAIPQQIQHCQIQVAFPSENFQGELFGLGLS